ncbi:hypothetical protein WN51_03493 [Melipona quadrifasciata]|uniref:Uncharacterized protein n=1 Tax=Melipona quadrifasciata TaxID=166423 RepID=A0A0M8ZWY3_9HYME|nr:hypothetical protein WN51_03493 [Melipona quadrifasciata]
MQHIPRENTLKQIRHGKLVQRTKNLIHGLILYPRGDVHEAALKKWRPLYFRLAHLPLKTGTFETVFNSVKMRPGLPIHSVSTRAADVLLVTLKSQKPDHLDKKFMTTGSCLEIEKHRNTMRTFKPTVNTWSVLEIVKGRSRETGDFSDSRINAEWSNTMFVPESSSPSPFHEQGGTKEEGQDKSRGLIENFRLLKGKFTPPRLLESARFGIQQSNELGPPFLAHRGGKLTGVVPGLDKSDSARPKRYESSGNDDSRAPTGIERASRNAVIEGRADGYRESAEAGAKEVAGEKRAIHSAGSRASTENVVDGKTGAGRGKQSAASRVSAGEIEEKSAGAKRQSHSEKKSSTSGKRERVPEDRGISSKKQLPTSGATDDRTKEDPNPRTLKQFPALVLVVGRCLTIGFPWTDRIYEFINYSQDVEEAVVVDREKEFRGDASSFRRSLQRGDFNLQEHGNIERNVTNDKILHGSLQQKLCGRTVYTIVEQQASQTRPILIPISFNRLVKSNKPKLSTIFHCYWYSQKEYFSTRLHPTTKQSLTRKAARILEPNEPLTNLATIAPTTVVCVALDSRNQGSRSSGLGSTARPNKRINEGQYRQVHKKALTRECNIRNLPSEAPDRAEDPKLLDQTPYRVKFFCPYSVFDEYNCHRDVLKKQYRYCSIVGLNHYFITESDFSGGNPENRASSGTYQQSSRTEEQSEGVMEGCEYFFNLRGRGSVVNVGENKGGLNTQPLHTAWKKGRDRDRSAVPLLVTWIVKGLNYCFMRIDSNYKERKSKLSVNRFKYNGILEVQRTIHTLCSYNRIIALKGMKDGGMHGNRDRICEETTATSYEYEKERLGIRFNTVEINTFYYRNFGFLSLVEFRARSIVETYRPWVFNLSDLLALIDQQKFCQE